MGSSGCCFNAFNERTPVAHTKNRGDVSGGGRKPWRQKGTGRARHGSSRSPLWRGGGVTFGPRNDKNYTKKINKKMKTKALYTVLSEKLRSNELLFIDDISFSAPKTADAKKTISTLGGIKGFENLATKKRNNAYIALGENTENKRDTRLSFRNFGNIRVDAFKDMNVSGLLNYKYLIIERPEESIELISKKIDKPKTNTKKTVTKEKKVVKSAKISVAKKAEVDKK